MAGDDSLQGRITEFWNTVAPEYEAHEGNVPVRASAEYEAWVEAIRDLLPMASSDVLDIATGTGFVALAAARLGHRVMGIDLAEAMLSEARREAAQSELTVNFELRDAVSPGFAAASFNAIVCRHFIWTLREPEDALRTGASCCGREAALSLSTAIGFVRSNHRQVSERPGSSTATTRGKHVRLCR